MNTENIDRLKTNICAIYEKKTMNPVKFDKIDIIKEAHKYSNTNIPIFKIYMNSKVLSRHNPYKIEYKCLICNAKSIINLELFQRKLNKNIIYCYHCKEQNETKRALQSDYMRNNQGKQKEENINKLHVSKISNLELIELSSKEFEEADEEFKSEYFKRHLNIEEFNYIKNRIISVQQKKFIDIGKYEYIPTMRIFNQTLFNPKLYDRENDKIEKIEYISFKCDVCDEIFEHRDLFVQKNKIKILCKNCSLCNNTFKIRKTNNYLKAIITYQSQLELKFIRFCNDNKIIIKDGPKIKYNWNDKVKTYIVDFYLPELDMLIEIKDDHIWHKEQVKNGIFKEKMNAIDTVIKDKTYKSFMLIFSKNLVRDCKTIKNAFDKI
jgi:transcription elongation factor Elf1